MKKEFSDQEKTNKNNEVDAFTKINEQLQPKKLTENTWTLFEEIPLPLTLISDDEKTATECSKIVQEIGFSYIHTENIILFISQHELEFIEISKYISQIVSQYKEHVNHQIEESDDWLSETDIGREYLLSEFEGNSRQECNISFDAKTWKEIQLFDGKNNYRISKFLESFNNDPDLFSLYMRRLTGGGGNPVYRLEPDDRDRKNWVALEKIGLAKRGKNLPINMIIGSLTISEINNILEKPQTRKIKKQKAIEEALEDKNIFNKISKNIPIRQIFQIVQPENISFDDMRIFYSYRKYEANIIHQNFRMNFNTLREISMAEEDYKSAWEIKSDDCLACSEIELTNKKHKTLPEKLPPFKIGCKCHLAHEYYF